MGGVVFDRSRALGVVRAKMTLGVDHVADNILAEAKRRAPVRKVRKYDRKSNRKVSGGGRGTPLRLGYFQQGSDRPIPDRVVLSLIQSARTQRAESRRISDRVSATLAKQTTLHQSPKTLRESLAHEAATRKEFTDVMLANGLELRSLDNDITAIAKKEIARGHGVRFNPETGAARLGGSLRKSIRKVKSKTSKLIIKREIRAYENYAKWVEEGTSHIKRAQPFMRPAIKRYGTVEALKQASRW